MPKRLFLSVLLAAMAGVALLLVGCETEQEVEEEPTATVQPTSTDTPPADDLERRRQEEERLRLEDEAKPRFDGVVNGIRIYPTNVAAPERKWACTDAKPEEVQHVDMSAVAGTPMEIVPTYLPAGAEESFMRLPPAICKGIVAYVERQWNIRGDGLFSIARYEGERLIRMDASADRVSPATIAGKPAVLVAPLTPEGYGPSSAIIAEEFGFSVVSAVDLPLDEAVKIGEGLR